MIPDCDGRSDGQTESIIANTALCIARAMLMRCKNTAGDYFYLPHPVDFDGPDWPRHTAIREWETIRSPQSHGIELHNTAHGLIGLTSVGCIGVASYRALGHVPLLDFQLCSKNILADSFVTIHCMNFIIFLCVTLKLFLLSFVPPSVLVDLWQSFAGSTSTMRHFGLECNRLHDKIDAVGHAAHETSALLASTMMLRDSCRVGWAPHAAHCWRSAQL